MDKIETSTLEIIVAEDNQIQRMYLVGLIRKLGYRTIETENGQEAFETLLKSDAHIVITDLQMPLLDGVELTKKIRNSEIGRYVHVIMLTGVEQQRERALAQEAGVDDFLAKGADLVSLQARIKTAARLVAHEQKLAEQNRILLETKMQIEEDLRAAAMAQKNMLPKYDRDILRFKVASSFTPSSYVSGDMYGCFKVSPCQLGFYIIDVSGHGVQAALLSVSLGHLITADYFKELSLKDGTPNPAALVASLNDRFFNAETDQYFTMFCGIIDCPTGKMDYCQAGHPSPIVVGNGSHARFIGQGGFPVAMLQDVEFDNDQAELHHGETMLLFSDAAVEAVNLKDEPFGEDRLAKLAEQASIIGRVEILEKIKQELIEWQNNQPLTDDLTLVSIERI